MPKYEHLRARNRSPMPSFLKLFNSWRTSYFHFSRIGNQLKERLIYYFHCASSNICMMNLQISNISDPLYDYPLYHLMTNITKFSFTFWIGVASFSNKKGSPHCHFISNIIIYLRRKGRADSFHGLAEGYFAAFRQALWGFDLYSQINYRLLQ